MEFLNKNKVNFGIMGEIPEARCLNLCVQNVRCTANKQIRVSIPLPGISNILDNCRGMVQYPGRIDINYAGFRVTNAKEEMVYCNTDRPGVKVTIEGQVVVRTVPSDELCPPVYIAFPVQISNDVLYNFYSAEDGSLITNLKNELAYVDGSCMTVQLNCTICRNSNNEYVARIRGNVTDKLWKRDSIWVEGIAPYPDSAMTFCDSFATPCASNDDCDTHDNGCNDEDED